jgi:predicted RNA-binding Zn-ribbon protein involved in translation (DUF1610 family)
MTNAATICANCEAPIVDPTTQVVHGALTFCCPNCSASMEESGSGSDPHTVEHPGDLLCARCGVAIVDRDTLMERDDLAYCCGNCAQAAAAGIAAH